MAQKWNISENTGTELEKGLSSSSFDDIDFCEESSNMSPKPRPRNDITAAIPSTPEDWTWDREHLTRMTNLLHSGFLSDITLIVGSDGKKIKAHKLFLQAGSPEFHRQLQKMNTDSDEDCSLTIENVEYEAFVMFLKVLFLKMKLDICCYVFSLIFSFCTLVKLDLKRGPRYFFHC